MRRALVIVFVALALVALVAAGGCGSDKATSSPLPTDYTGPQPPAWLVSYAKKQLQSLGDPNGSVWWGQTTMGQSEPANEVATVKDKKALQLVFHGNFTGNGTLSYPPGNGSPSTFTWAWLVLDAQSHKPAMSETARDPNSALSIKVYRLRL